jgi:cyclophilin family peptidyl-prolyl cis-trans isomerase
MRSRLRLLAVASMALLGGVALWAESSEALSLKGLLRRDAATPASGTDTSRLSDPTAPSLQSSILTPSSGTTSGDGASLFPSETRPFKLHGARLKTAYGDIVVELFPKHAPKTVANFEALVASGFYNIPNLNFHRVVPGFVVQTGDPTGTGTGGSGKHIELEVHPDLSHTGKGILAMARSTDPDSASSQFYFTLDSQPHLDGKYAVFGRVIQGLSILDKLSQGDTVLGIQLQDVSGVAVESTAPKLSTKSYMLKQIFKANNRKRPS